MDSRSGPESSSKVHAFGEAVKRPIGKPLETFLGCALIWGSTAAVLAGCGPNFQEPAGVLGVIAEGCAKNDARVLFPALEEQARHALDAIVNARKQARTLVEKSYPAEARSEALNQLGDAAQTENGAGLFAARCEGECLRQLCEGVGAPSVSTKEGSEVRVATVRGGKYVLAAGKDQRLGVVWHTDELKKERRRAYAELSSIESNAKVYEQQRALK